MSQNTIQTKIEQIRNETQQYGNTRGRVADLLTMLNTEKLDKAAVQGVVSEIVNLAPEFLEYVQSGNFTITADAGFGGDLVVADDPAPTKPTWYFAKESGTYPNAGGLVVDLTNKLVILSYDGTTWSKSEVDAQVRIVEEYQNNPYELDSPQKNGNDTAEAYYNAGVLSASAYLLNPNAVNYDRFIRDVFVRTLDDGNFKIVFGTLLNNVFTETHAFNATNGNTSIGEKLPANHHIAIKTPSTSRLGYRYGSGSLIFDNYGSGNDSGLQFSYSFTSQNIIGTKDVFVTKSEFINQYNYGADVMIGIDTKTDYYPYVVTNGYCFIKENLATKSLLKQIKIDTASAGYLTFAFGIVDQWNKFVERKTVKVEVVSGMNSLIFNEVLNAGEYVAIKGASDNVRVSYLTIGNTSTNFFYSETHDGTLQEAVINKLQMQTTIAPILYENPYATKTTVDAMQVQIDLLMSKIATLTAVKFKSILHFGNSMLWHSLQSYWWGEWGMAATQESKDYAHQFLFKVQQTSPEAVSRSKNIAVWETNTSGFDKNTLDSEFTVNPDLVVVRLGENVTWHSNFRNDFRALIDYIISKAPTAKIIIGGTFWYSPEKDADMKAVADEKSIVFVSMQGLAVGDNLEKVGNQVYGNDGQLHTIDSEGVAAHPSDAGMLAIAERLFSAL